MIHVAKNHGALRRGSVVGDRLTERGAVLGLRQPCQRGALGQREPWWRQARDGQAALPALREAQVARWSHLQSPPHFTTLFFPSINTV